MIDGQDTYAAMFLNYLERERRVPLETLRGYGDDVDYFKAFLDHQTVVYNWTSVDTEIINETDIVHPLFNKIVQNFKYINGKTTSTLSLDDLKIDSPYNSYTHNGLPPTPISNPGIGTIRDTITPTKTPYLYFLTDSEGIMHYAVTHDEHVRNKEKYLK